MEARYSSAKTHTECYEDYKPLHSKITMPVVHLACQTGQTF